MPLSHTRALTANISPLFLEPAPDPDVHAEIDVNCLLLFRSYTTEVHMAVTTTNVTIVHNALISHISRAAFDTLDMLDTHPHCLLFYLGFIVFLLILDSNHPITCHGLFKFPDALD